MRRSSFAGPTRRDFIRVLVGVATTGAIAPVWAQLAGLSRELLVGTWRGEEQGALGVMSLEVIFFPNGTYRRSHRLNDLMTFDTGSYTIVQNWIHFKLEGYGPRIYKGQPMQWPESDTWVVNQLDSRTLVASVGGINNVRVFRQ